MEHLINDNKEIAENLKRGFFYPNFDFVMFLGNNLENIIKNKSQSYGITIDLALEYLSKYSTNCRYVMMNYTHLSDKTMEGFTFHTNLDFGENDSKFPIFNFDILNQYFYQNYGVFYGNFISLSQDTNKSILFNLQILYISELNFYNFLSQKISSSNNLSIIDFENIAESFLYSFLFIDGIVRNYNIKLSQNNMPLSSEFKMEDDEYYFILFHAKDLFYRLGNKEKVDLIESIIEKHFIEYPESYWQLHHYKFKYIYTLDNKYITELSKISKILISKQLYGIDITECKLFIDIEKLLNENNYDGLDEIIEKFKIDTKKDLIGYSKIYSNQFLIDNEVLNKEAITNFLEILKLGLEIKANFGNQEILLNGLEKITGILNDIVYRLIYNFEGGVSFRFDLYKLLLNIKNYSNNKLKEKLDFINKVKVNYGFHSENESKIYDVIVEIIQSKISGVYYIPEDLYIRFTNTLTSMSLESHILLAIIYNLRKEKISALSEEEQINNYIYESLRIIEEDISKYKKLGEEDIRSEIVSMLKILTRVNKTNINISSESKNANGKTDIMIIIGNNKYIFECLVWGGITKYIEKYNQLLGYLTPSNINAGLISFVKNHKNYIEVIDELENYIKNNSTTYEKEKDYFYTSNHKTNIHTKITLSHHISYLTSK
ncbi:MAG: hypothetical protein AB7E37_00585 [Candidatus Altimarinota bacterium]